MKALILTPECWRGEHPACACACDCPCHIPDDDSGPDQFEPEEDERL